MANGPRSGRTYSRSRCIRRTATKFAAAWSFRPSPVGVWKRLPERAVSFRLTHSAPQQAYLTATRKMQSKLGRDGGRVNIPVASCGAAALLPLSAVARFRNRNIETTGNGSRSVVNNRDFSGQSGNTQMVRKHGNYSFVFDTRRLRETGRLRFPSWTSPASATRRTDRYSGRSPRHPAGRCHLSR